MANRKRRNNSIPLILMSLGGLLILVIGGWLAWKAVQPAAAPEPSAGQESNVQDAPRVTLEEAKAAYDKNEAVFLDVRDADSYASDHIPGALSIPLSELPDRHGELDPNTWIITYCT